MPAKVPIELEVIVTHPARAAKERARTASLSDGYFNNTITVPKSESSKFPTV